MLRKRFTDQLEFILGIVELHHVLEIGVSMLRPTEYHFLQEIMRRDMLNNVPLNWTFKVSIA
jgi:hypothetical protein